MKKHLVRIAVNGRPTGQRPPGRCGKKVRNLPPKKNRNNETKQIGKRQISFTKEEEECYNSLFLLIQPL